MYLKIYLTFLLAFILFAKINAQQVDTLIIKSMRMQKNIKCIVIKPAKYKKLKTAFPVVYLLHGHSGAYNNWVNKVPGLLNQATVNNTIIVCPDGGYSSWYFNSPIDSTMAYESYIINDVVPFIDSSYKTIPTPKGRAITGLSMGGHGALYLASQHPNIFGAAGSMSGGVNLYESKNKYDLIKRIGDTIINLERWQNLSAINFLPKIANNSLALIIDCGVDDIFYNGNITLHKNLMAAKINHDFIIRPGKHNWEYWSNAIIYQLGFFKIFFEKNGMAK